MIDAYCVDDFAVKRFVSRDQFNEPTYSTVPVKGYIEWDNKLIRNLAGELVVSAAHIYFPYIFELTFNDYIIIEAIEHAILKIDKKKDFSTTHYEVYIA